MASLSTLEKVVERQNCEVAWPSVAAAFQPSRAPGADPEVVTRALLHKLEDRYSGVQHLLQGLAPRAAQRRMGGGGGEHGGPQRKAQPGQWMRQWIVSVVTRSASSSSETKGCIRLGRRFRQASFFSYEMSTALVHSPLKCECNDHFIWRVCFEKCSGAADSVCLHPALGEITMTQVPVFQWRLTK